jgi:hypothetical protein
MAEVMAHRKWYIFDVAKCRLRLQIATVFFQ